MKQTEIKYNEIKEGDYRIYISHEIVTIQHLDYPKVLKIEKVSCNVSESDQNVLSKLTVLSVIRPHAIIGILKVEGHSFLMYVETSELVGNILDSADIFKILEINYIPLFDEGKQILSSEIINYLTSIKNLFTMGFYYSFKYNISISRQSQSKTNISNSWDSEKKYILNYIMNKTLLFEQKVNNIWITACIFGYINIEETQISGENVKFAIISRRSYHQAGTRYNARGINDNGNVANYVETEQILKIKNNLYSTIILRGSAPIFFDQSPINFQIIIARNPSMTSPAFMKHLSEIQSDFKYVMMMNLMSESKPGEELISTNFKNQFLINNIDHCKYHIFDLHQECKKDKFEKLEEYINEKLLKILDNFNFFCEDENKKVISLQKGVFRVNCLDCLDRTNIFQSRLCWQILLHQVTIHKLILVKKRRNKYRLQFRKKFLLFRQ